LNESEAEAKPVTLGFEEAAALPLVLITAWEALFDRAALAAGQTVLNRCAELIAEGKLKPIVYKTLPLNDAFRAHELNEAGHVQGKIVLTCKQEST
jgi:NADPH:quinone reductase-like Zn-dependent oxidoreductase